MHMATPFGLIFCVICNIVAPGKSPDPDYNPICHRIVPWLVSLALIIFNFCGVCTFAYGTLIRWSKEGMICAGDINEPGQADPEKHGILVGASSFMTWWLAIQYGICGLMILSLCATIIFGI